MHPQKIAVNEINYLSDFMRENHRMEDENEWPYLVWENKGEYGGSRNTVTPSLNLSFENRPFGEFSSCVNRLLIDSSHKRKILSSIKVEPRNCSFSLRQEDEKIRMSLVLENEYLTSQFNGFYDLNSCELTFYYPFHSHNRLESMSWFESEIRRVKSESGLGFDEATGGYKFEWRDDNLRIKDQFEVLAMFSDGGERSDTHSYKVDFKNRKLVKYHVHDWFEFFDPVY